MNVVKKSNISVNTNAIDEWQSSKETLKARFSFLCNNDKLADVYFILGIDKHRIPAHKVVLSASSVVFERMFFGPLATKSNEIELPDIEPPRFLAFLKFIYTDEAHIDHETAMSTMYISKKYNLPVLEMHCLKFLKNCLDADNAILLLTQARFFDEPHLAEMCLDYIDRNAIDVFAVDDFIDVDLATLIVIIERDTLKINEYKLYQVILRWTEAECVRKQLPVTPENQRSVLGRAFMLIRFPLMTIKELAIGPVKSGLMTDQEVKQFYLYFLINGSQPPLGFLDVSRTMNEQTVRRFRMTYEGMYESLIIADIGFMVDRRIFIVGFGLYGSYRQSAKCDVDIKLLHSDILRASRKTSFKSDGSNKTYQVKFKNPIEILPNEIYTASVVLKGASSWRGSKGTHSVTIDGLDGEPVNFKFFMTKYNFKRYRPVTEGQIPEIIFYT